MKYNVLNYKLMRARKYYDVIRTNRSFLKAPLNQKVKIVVNVLKFFNNISKKPLVINNKPVTAQIEPTSECNLRCRMCVREKMHAKIGRMSFEDFKKIIDKLDTLFKINVSGQGELFMHPEIFKMINYANKRGILVNINSNGTLLNKSIIDNICKSDIGEMGISIDSPTKEKYEKIRIGANYDKLLENIKALSSELKRRKRHTILTMTPIIFKENIDELPNFIRLAKKIGMTKVAMQTLQTKENFLKSYDKDMKNQLVIKDLERLRKKMKEAKKLAIQYGIPLIFDEEESPGCIWPWRGMYVTCSGDVTTCCKIVDTREYSMGNILKENFWDLWNGEKYQQMRKLLRNRKSPAACIGCNAV